MVEDTKKLLVLFTVVGNMLVNDKKRTKLLSKGEGIWQQKAARLFKFNYSMYQGAGFNIVCIFTGLLTLFGILDLFGTTIGGVTWSNSSFLICNIIFFILLLLLIVVRNSQEKTVIDILKNDRVVSFENGILKSKSDKINVEWNVDSCIFMIDTQYGYFLIFEGSPLQFISVRNTESYEMLYAEIKNSVNDGVYKLIAI